jgi:hypothetical protein
MGISRLSPNASQTPSKPCHYRQNTKITAIPNINEPLIFIKLAQLVPKTVGPTSSLPVWLTAGATVELGTFGAPTAQPYAPHPNAVFPLPVVWLLN